MHPDRHAERVLKLVREAGVLRPRDLDAEKIPREYLARLLRRGDLERPSRGVYVLADADVTESHSLAEVCKRVPKGIVCLLSALQLHQIGTQIPHEVWITIEGKARAPRMDSPALRIVRASGEALTWGVEERRIEGVLVKVYSPAKTVADCFKYRSKIGIDVALEALRETWKARKARMDDLLAAARVCRVANVIRPYLESLTT